ncbi:hypothetical protein FF011L_38490 [Roseimaritima multifibrata]|uniref:VWFA domain-containing protein n=1 Tax=Roseimaritima multifibrata TaxID=1930274 RepID=A0A517MJI9_9BACT|nr:BatA and WFA domain-containing protein [Roseimaritima multifibrata]QDS95065.1 hypothetical protein FF011L_38490 [Roseimaritima multifibrata]
MLNFASPERWIWLLAAIPIVACFFLRSRRKSQAIATLQFWDQAFHDQPPRSWGGPLRYVGSLFLQLLILGILVFALLNPQQPVDSASQKHLIFVLDRSASMQATDGSGSRWQQALAAIDAELRSVTDGQQVALLATGQPVQVIVGMSDSAAAVRDRLPTLKSGDGPTDLLAAIEMASRLAPDQSSVEIVVVTDGAGGTWVAERLEEFEGVRILSVGRPVANAGITQFQARRSFNDPLGVTVMLEVESFIDAADAPISGRVHLELEGELLDVWPIELTGRKVWRKDWQHVTANGGKLTARLEIFAGTDGLAVDNEAFAYLPPRPSVPVNLVSEVPATFVANGLRSIAGVELFESISPLSPRPANGVTVLNGVVPNPLPAGPLLVLNPPAASPFWELGDSIPQPIVETQADSSPLLSHVHLVNVTLPEARALRLTAPNHQPLLKAAGNQVMMAVQRVPDGSNPQAGGLRRMVLLSGNIEAGELPMRVAFPILLSNSIDWLSLRSLEWTPSLRTGQVIQRLGTDGQVSIGPWETVGWHSLERSGASVGSGAVQAAETEVATAPIAVNLASRTESNLLQDRPEIDRPAQTSRKQPVAYWWYIIAASIGLLVIEWGFYQRRMVG